MNTGQFDNVADAYENTLRRNLRFIPGGVDHYYANRARITALSVSNPEKIRRVLDFGGGVGLAYPHLRHNFPNAEILIFDTSKDSVTRALRNNVGLRAIEPEDFNKLNCDIVFVAGVVHHVPAEFRNSLISTLVDCVASDGIVAIFELNPYNPITRRLVKTCPFDSDADLITRANLRRLASCVPDLREIASRFIVFFPPIFRLLLTMERFLGWLPLGAQYYLIYRKVPRIKS